MFEGPANNTENPNGQSAQEILREQIDTVLDDYFLLLSKRGLDGEDRVQLDKNIQEKRELLVQLTQRLNGQLELDNTFSEQVDEQLQLADKGIEGGKEELAARADGKENVEAILADMRAYGEELSRVDTVLDSIKAILGNEQQEEKEELEVLIFELKTMIGAFMKIGGEIQKLIVSLKVDNKNELITRQLKIMNDAVSAIKNFDETERDLDKLNKIKRYFYEHFDEALHFYEELRDLTK